VTALFAAVYDELACIFGNDSATLFCDQQRTQKAARYEWYGLHVTVGGLGRSMCNHRWRRGIYVSRNSHRRIARVACGIVMTCC